MAEYRLDVPADIAEIPRLLDWVETCCGESGVGGDVPSKLILALDEAVANVINYAFTGTASPHRIAVVLEFDGDRVAAEIIDNGRPFDPSATPEPDCTAPLGTRDVGGLGIHLIRRVMDRVEYRRAGDENRLRLEKRRT
ncbi:MAG TPA: ATP-binding protein [Stellaceae bacterium]|nr:ATP-binding protein [Stellaceae bacterium]